MSSTETTSTKHAWYSAKQEAQRSKLCECIPSCLWYTDAEGKSVEVTMITTGPEHGCNEELLDDIEYRGIVERYTGVCRK